LQQPRGSRRSVPVHPPCSSRHGPDGPGPAGRTRPQARRAREFRASSRERAAARRRPKGSGRFLV